MVVAGREDLPLISVIIPGFNHARFISDAIDSVMHQSYQNIEIIVVNDGSNDDTEDVVSKFPGVRYIFQTNQGLSAARNTGIKMSKGEYLVFLDADDLLYKDGILTNYQMMLLLPDIAFVSGAHDKVNYNKEMLEEGITMVDGRHYYHFLQGNYIGMHAAVMYRRGAFNHFLFDTALKACEDYDLYLKLARIFPVYHHQKKIAAYRIHSSNMSSNEGMMLNWVLYVLRRQKPFLISRSEQRAYYQGRKNWIDYYREIIIKRLAYDTNEKIWDVLWKMDKIEFFKQRMKRKFRL